MGKLTFSVHHNGSHGFKNGPKVFPHTYKQHILYGECLGSWSLGAPEEHPTALAVGGPHSGVPAPRI